MMADPTDPYALPKELESAAEVAFWLAARRWMDDDLEIKPQVVVKTAAGNYRVDFVIGSIAFEIDGKAYHAHRGTEDYARDLAILEVRPEWRMYRIAATNPLYHPEAMMFWFCLRYPALFKERAPKQLARLVGLDLERVLREHGNQRWTVGLWSRDEEGGGPVPTLGRIEEQYDEQAGGAKARAESQ